MRKMTRATVYSIDGDRVNLRFSKSPNLIKHVRVIGNARNIIIGSEVSLTWEDGRPVALPIETSVVAPSVNAMSASGNILFPNNWIGVPREAYCSTALTCTSTANQNEYNYWSFSGLDEYLSWTFLGAAGAYTYELLGVNTNLGGIVHLYIDNDFIEEWDGYAASPTYNVINTGLTSLKSSGRHNVVIKVIDKNSSSSGYYWRMTYFKINLA